MPGLSYDLDAPEWTGPRDRRAPAPAAPAAPADERPYPEFLGYPEFLSTPEEDQADA